jgi:hypothetical protein
MSNDASRRRRGALRSFVFGGVVGGVIAVAAPRMRRRSIQHRGLEAFEGAPCWEYDHPAGQEPARPAAEAAERSGESL